MHFSSAVFQCNFPWLWICPPNRAANPLIMGCRHRPTGMSNHRHFSLATKLSPLVRAREPSPILETELSPLVRARDPSPIFISGRRHFTVCTQSIALQLIGRPSRLAATQTCRQGAEQCRRDLSVVLVQQIMMGKMMTKSSSMCEAEHESNHLGRHSRSCLGLICLTACVHV